jgi:hypothetical protein
MFRQKKRGKNPHETDFLRDILRENWIVISVVCDALLRMDSCHQILSKIKIDGFQFFFKSHYITLDMVSAGLHCSLSMSKHIFPLLFIFGWNTLVLKATCKAYLYRRISQSFFFFQSYD